MLWPQSRTGQAGDRTGSARSPQTLLPVPRDPRQGAQSTHRPPPPSASPFSTLALHGALAFPAAWKEPAAGGSPTAPSPKAAGVGLHRLSTKECGCGWGRTRLQTKRAGELGARSRAGWGELQPPRAAVGPSEMSPRWRTGCPRSHPAALQPRAVEEPRPLSRSAGPAAPSAITD